MLLAGAVAMVVPSGVLSASLCITPESFTVDCNQILPASYAVDWTGFSEEANPCRQCTHPNDYGGCSAPYLWTISASATHSDENDGPLPESGWLYLWLHRTVSDGMVAAEIGLTGDLRVTDFELIYPAALWVPRDPPNLLSMTFGGCPMAPTLVGRVHVVPDPSSANAADWGRTKALYR